MSPDGSRPEMNTIHFRFESCSVAIASCSVYDKDTF